MSQRDYQVKLLCYAGQQAENGECYSGFHGADAMATIERKVATTF